MLKKLKLSIIFFIFTLIINPNLNCMFGAINYATQTKLVNNKKALDFIKKMQKRDYYRGYGCPCQDDNWQRFRRISGNIFADLCFIFTGYKLGQYECAVNEAKK